jgi:signal transduction histidine kinase
MRAQQMMAGQNRALELIASNAPLIEILDFIARFIESQTTGMRCSVLLVEGGRLRHGAAPSLPREFVQAIDGREIGPSVGSCGTAAFTGEMVIVTDIAVDPLWQNYRDLALPHGLRACWSTPIFAADHQVIGTFAIYYPNPSGPRADDWHLVKIATHLVGIAIERHRTDEELRQRATQLQEANRQKDEFLAMLSHELRNPLAPILMATELIRSQSDNPASVEKYRAVIDRQARHLSHLVDDLLDVTRGARGKIVLAREPVAVAALVTQAQETAAPLIAERRHTLSVHLPSEPLLVYADPIRMTQVLANLLSNAAKYTAPGGRISVSAERAGEDIVIRVRDTGRGIEKDLLLRIFEPFFQAGRSRSNPEGGLGVGLSLVQNLVALHGGHTEALSDGPDQGSELVIRLPAFRERASAPVAAI